MSNAQPIFFIKAIAGSIPTFRRWIRRQIQKMTTTYRRRATRPAAAATAKDPRTALAAPVKIGADGVVGEVVFPGTTTVPVEIGGETGAYVGVGVTITVE